jgi:hypothetical protein
MRESGMFVDSQQICEDPIFLTVVNDTVRV